MPLWLWLVDSFVLVVALVVGPLLWLALRRRVVTRGARSAFDVSANRAAADGGWMLGFAVFRGAEMHWYRTFSLSLRPKYRLGRGEAVVEGRRAPHGEEVHAVHPGHVIVSTDRADGVRQLAMSPRSLTALLAWLESSPPGQRVNNVV